MWRESMPVESSEEYFMNVLREVQTLLSLCLHTQCLLTTRSTWIALYFVVWIIDWELNPHSYRMSPSHPVTLTIVLYYNIGQHDFAAYSNFLMHILSLPISGGKSALKPWLWIMCLRSWCLQNKEWAGQRHYQSFLQGISLFLCT